MPASSPPAAPSRWPGHRLGRRHGEPARVVAEAPLDGDRLDPVVVRRRGAVGVDVIDGVRGSTPAASRAFFIDAYGAVAVLGRRGHVVGVAGHAVADELGVDACAARPRVLELLEHDDARRPRRARSRRGRGRRDGSPARIVVAGRQRAHGAEPADAHRRDGRLRAAGDHHVGSAAPDDLVGVADGVRRGGARGARGRVGAPCAPNGSRPGRRRVDDGRRDEEGRDAARPRPRATPCARARSW